MENEKINIGKDQVFIDSHMHLFNMSHAGLLSYLNRFLKNKSHSYNELLTRKNYFNIFLDIILKMVFKKDVLIKASKFLFYFLFISFIVSIILSGISLIPNITSDKILLSIFKWSGTYTVTILLLIGLVLIFNKIKQKIKGKSFQTGFRKVVNLLSVMENDIGSSLELLELDILDLDSKLNNKILKSLDRKNRRKFNLHRLFDNNSFSDIERNAVVEIIKNYLGSENKNGFQLEISSCDNGTIKQQYNRYIMTPLIVDYGYKNYDLDEIHYSSPPSKPVVAQTKDVLEGIKNYHINSKFKIFEIYPFMGINPNRYDWDDNYIDDNEAGSTDKKCNDAKGKELEGNSINKMMNKYFASFEKNDLAMIRLGKFKEKAKDYSGNLDENPAYFIFKKEFQDKIKKSLIVNKLKEIHENKDSKKQIISKLKGELSKKALTFTKSFEQKSDGKDEIFKNIDEYLFNNINKNKLEDYIYPYNYFFTGLKVYPPLGFDPWPKKNNNNQQKKVEYIYCYCQKRGIPIVTHCNNGGFTIESKTNIEKYTNPKRWSNVLKTYPELKINFAHLGGDEHDDEKQWRESIFTYCIEYENVYTDFSCMCFNHKDYIRLNNQIEDYLKSDCIKADIDKNRKKLYKRIMYGTDFSINLMFGTDSYQDYLNEFINTKAFSKDIKDLFSYENPMRFLFDKTIPHNKKQNHGNNKQKSHDC